MSDLVGAETLTDFAHRARERVAAGESVAVTIGTAWVVLDPQVRDAVLAVLDAAADATIGSGAPGAVPEEASTGQAADLLGVTRSTVVRLIERGDLPATRVGTRRRLATADVLACRERARSGRSATLRDVIAASRDLDLYR